MGIFLFNNKRIFGEWNMSSGYTEVFEDGLLGVSIKEIAKKRGSAVQTVKNQMQQFRQWAAIALDRLIALGDNTLPDISTEELAQMYFFEFLSLKKYICANCGSAAVLKNDICFKCWIAQKAEQGKAQNG